MHHKGYYRTVNGKVIHVDEGGQGQGRPAELHERTAIGKHSSGSHYLRASDAEDGAKIKKAAEEVGVHMEKRRAGANHFGRVGAYDHYHTEKLEDAQKVHAHLKGQGGAATPEPAPAGTIAQHKETQRQEMMGRNTAARTALSTPEEKSSRAWDASRDAYSTVRQESEAGPKHAEASKRHKQAAEAHLKAHDEAHAKGDEGAKEHFFNASRHFAKSAEHAGHALAPDVHANVMSAQAAKLGEHADAQRLEENHHSYDAHASSHLLAAEAHGRARDANNTAATVARMKGDEAGEAYHAGRANRHYASAQKHSQEINKNTKEIGDRKDAAYKASREATTPEGHRAAAAAHARAAKIDYDSDTRAMHEHNVETHSQIGNAPTEPVTVQPATPSKGHEIPAPDPAAYNGPRGYTQANIRSHDALEAAELAEDHTEAGKKATALSADAHSLTAYKRSHADSADAHGAASKAHKDLHAKAPNRYHKEAAEHHDAMVEYHSAQDPTRRSSTAPKSDRPMQKAIIEAQVQHLDAQTARVGGDTVALAALAMRRQALQTEQE